VNNRCLKFYFTREEINIENIKKLEGDEGIYINQDIWRKNEMIEFSDPVEINGYGTLYYIQYCNQFVNKGKIKEKSKLFEEDTTKLRSWLKAKFVTKRGNNCFDGVEAYTNFITKRNSSR
jgi:hypothetical protein